MGGATKRGAYQHIRLTMQPTRPRLSGDMRILGRLKVPVAAKFNASSARRRVLTPKQERGLVLILGADGLLCAGAVGTFGAVSAGRKWDRLARAAHRRDLKLFGRDGFFLMLFSDGALVLPGSGISEEPFSSNTPLMV